jgi:hypothetical protein
MLLECNVCPLYYIIERLLNARQKKHLCAFYQGYLESGNKCSVAGKWTIEEGKKERRKKKRKEKKREARPLICCTPSAMRSCNMRNIKERVEERREREERETG